LKDKRSAISVVVAGLLVALLIGFGLNLRSSQESSRNDLLARFTDSAKNDAALVSALFSSSGASSGAQLTKDLGGGSVSQSSIDRRIRQGNAPYGVLLTDQGRVLVASTGAPAAAIANIKRLPDYVEAALGKRSFGLSDVLSASNGDPIIEFAQGFTAADSSRRVFVSAIDPKVLTGFLGAYLDQTRRLDGGDAYITDSNGVVIASTAGASPSGAPIAEPDLLQRSLNQEAGEYGDGRNFASVPVESTNWRVVATAPSNQLLSAVQGANKWVPWLIFIAFGLAAGAAFALLRRTLANAARLEVVNEQLEGSNDQLEHRAEELRRSNEELELFASIASHDLSEPLRKVQMFSKQLQVSEAEHLSETGNDYIARMAEAAKRMETLIQDLLEFSRVTTRGRPFSPVDLGEVFQAAVSDLDVPIAESGAKVEVGDLPVIQADPLQMRQLAQNLVSNAVKFHREGEPSRVRVDGEIRDGKAQIVVADNGIGFEQRYAMRIFRVFERLHGRNAYPGTGIGLGLCRKIAERHEGGIVAEGKPGEGATFTVTLPVRQFGPVHPNGSHTPAEQSKEPAVATK
jgi:Bacteriophytochrome (light-regulated signal transduction histidine kinase)